MKKEKNDYDFKPKGAVAFFCLLITALVVLWYSLYFIMLDKS